MIFLNFLIALIFSRRKQGCFFWFGCFNFSWEILTQNSAFNNFSKYGQLDSKLFFHIFGFIFPHKAIFLFGVYKVDKVGTFVLRNAFELLYFLDQIGFI